MFLRQKKSKFISLFNVVDVETLQPLKLSVKLEYYTQKGEPRQETRITPLFQKTNEIWKRITIKNEDYYKLNFEIIDQAKTKFLFVKKKFLHQIDIKEFKNVVMASRDDFELNQIKKILKSSYLWNYFNILINENQLNDDIGNRFSSNGLIKKYFVAIFKILKKGKSNLLPIYLTYFFGFHNDVAGVENGNFMFNKNFSINSKLISSFEFFLSVLTKR